MIDQLARTPLSEVIIFVAILTAARLAIAPVMSKVPLHRRGLGYTFLRWLNEALDAIIYAGVFVFLIIRPFCIQAFKIPSGSMIPTLLEGDFIVANKAIYRYTDPKVGDIVVFRPPKIACTPDQIDKDGQVNVDFIKRCIGTPGDIVEVKNDILYRNGKATSEPYIREQMTNDFKLVNYKGKYWPLRISGDYVNNDPSTTAAPFLLNDMKQMDMMRNLPSAPVPKGYYLFMGDNRNESYDGRSWGLVPRNAIIGRSEFIWMPINRWRITR